MKKILMTALLAVVACTAWAQQKTEKEMLDEEFRYRFQEKDEAKSDSMHKLIVKTYPNGWTVRRDAFMEAFNHKQDYHQYIVGLLKKWPMQESALLPDYQEFVYYNAIRSFVSDYYSGEFDQQEIIGMMPGMDFKTLAEIFRSTAFPYHVKKAVSDTIIFPMAKALIAQMEQKTHDHSYCEQGYMTESQSDSLAEALLSEHRGTYADILLSMGRPQEAVRQIALIAPARRYQTPEVNETHIKALQQTGQDGLADEVMKQAILANAATPAMMDLLKQRYTASHGSADGFEQYLSSLKSKDEVAALKDEIRKVFIKEPYRPFRLKDMNGNEVNSADWQGKVVVLDFWASWCYPCKNSFPGMQMAVDRFKDDPNILFYFIDTMEHTDGYEQKARNYMKENGFNFQVLFDAKADAKKAGNNQVVFSQMNAINHSMAIPRKMILKDGYIRLTQEGYGGSPSRLADEVSYAIEMLKQE